MERQAGFEPAVGFRRGLKRPVPSTTRPQTHMVGQVRIELPHGGLRVRCLSRLATGPCLVGMAGFEPAFAASVTGPRFRRPGRLHPCIAARNRTWSHSPSEGDAHPVRHGNKLATCRGIEPLFSDRQSGALPLDEQALVVRLGFEPRITPL